MRKPALLSAACFALACAACDTIEITDLRQNLATYNTAFSEKDLGAADSATGRLNYVKPLYACWHSGTAHYSTGNLYKALAIVGDHESIIGRFSYNYCDNDTTEEIKSAAAFPAARASILEQFKSHRVIMFNDAPHRIQGRAFFLELLEELRKAGATHLAL